MIRMLLFNPHSTRSCIASIEVLQSAATVSANVDLNDLTPKKEMMAMPILFGWPLYCKNHPN